MRESSNLREPIKTRPARSGLEAFVFGSLGLGSFRLRCCEIPDIIDRGRPAAGLSIGGREGTAARVTIDGESGCESERGMDPPVVRPRQTVLTGSGLHLGKGWGRRGR